MINRIKQCLPVFSLALFSGCVIAASQPDWVNGDPLEFPNSQYLTATGSASKQELAKDRALGNLSKIFETQVKEVSTTKSDTHVSINNGNENYTKKHHLAQQIQIRTDKIINGARIAETWTDKTVFTHHALAVLDRRQAGSNIREEINRIDEETTVQLQNSSAAKDVLVSMASMSKAIGLQQERVALNKMLRVINLSGKGYPSEWNLSELQVRLDNRLQSLDIGTAVDNDPVGKLHQLLKSAMGNAGFPAGNGHSDFTLVANLDVQDLGFRQGWYWLRGKLSVKLVEKDGKVRGRKQWPLKASALQQNDAESRLLTQVSEKLNSDIKAAVIEFATTSN